MRFHQIIQRKILSGAWVQTSFLRLIEYNALSIKNNLVPHLQWAQAILCYTCTEPHLAHLFFPTIVPYYCRRSFFFLNWARIYLTLINLLLCYQRIFQYLFENYQENKAKYCRIGKQYYSYAIIKFIYLCWF